jgi:hypothetical protein
VNGAKLAVQQPRRAAIPARGYGGRASEIMIQIMARANLFILAASVALAQSAAVFEVASVKLSRPSGDLLNGVGGCLKPELSAGPCSGRFIARAANLKMLVEYAYHVHRVQVAGGPGWIGGYPISTPLTAITIDHRLAPLYPATDSTLMRGRETLTRRPTRCVRCFRHF